MVQSSVAQNKLNPVPVRPAKPYPDFPLFPHATGRWAKKVRGKLHYFGKWEDPNGALQKWLDEQDDLRAGRTPRAKADALDVAEMCNRFLAAKKQLVDNQEIGVRTFKAYRDTCLNVIEAFGRTRLVSDLATDDFERFRTRLAEGLGPVSLGNEIQRVRILFKFAYDAGLINQPMRYGPGFKRPAKRLLRLARNARGPRMFDADELRRIIDASTGQMKAMILLGANAGFGNADVATLPMGALDLKNGWVNFPRPKTGIERRCKLWPETVSALREAIDARQQHKSRDDAGLVFITCRGSRWVRLSPKEVFIDSVGLEFSKILVRLKLKRPGLGFYALRHGFETIGGGAKDQVAVDAIMGHARDDMASLYREGIDDSRLEAVAEHVRQWLFPAKKQATGWSGR
jgi:integrase